MDAILLWNNVEQGLAEHVVGPTLRALNIGVVPADEPGEIARYFMLCAIQIGLIFGMMRPLESWLPVERWASLRPTRIDRLYTLLKLLVVVPAFNYLIMAPFFHDTGDSAPLQLDHWFPALQAYPLAVFFAYLLIYDFTLYCVHRLQHAVPWWWGLHSLHHSQTQLNCWSNDRDHYLDDLLEVLVLSAVSALIGVAPVEYSAIVLVGQLIENFSHANVRIGFGPILNKILVDPPYHRLHHMRANAEHPGRHNCNFALVFPVWDIVFGTARYNTPPQPCGVDDPAIDADNQLGLFGQQAAGFRRFVAGFRRRSPSTI